MSLPSYAISYDANGKELHREFINAGWYINKDTWLNCIKTQVYKVPGASLVEVYGIKFTPKWLHPKYEDMLAKLYDERDAVYRQKSNLDGHRDIIRFSSSISAEMVALVRGMGISKLIASDIVGVQPMSEPANLVFSLCYRYGPKSKWYYRLYEYLRKVLVQGDDDAVFIVLNTMKARRRKEEQEQEAQQSKIKWHEIQERIDNAYKEKTGYE
jgi:hypothetical protein